MKTQDGTIIWNDTKEVEEVLFGIIPEDGFDLVEDDDTVFFWLEDCERVVDKCLGEFTILSLGDVYEF